VLNTLLLQDASFPVVGLAWMGAIAWPASGGELRLSPLRQAFFETGIFSSLSEAAALTAT